MQILNLLYALVVSSLLLMGTADKVRTRMLAVLKQQGFSDTAIKRYAEDRAILLENEDLSEWPEHKLPSDKPGMDKLAKDVAAFVGKNLTQQGPIPSVSEQAGAAADLKKAKRVKQNISERQVPHSEEMERGVLGCVLIDPLCLSACIERFGDREVFYDLRHQTIYSVMVAMADERKPIEIITLQQALKDRGRLDDIGGIPYLLQLQDSTPSAANLNYYLDVVMDKAILRWSIAACTDATAQAYNCKDVALYLDDLERKALAIRPRKENSATAKQLVHRVIEDAELRFNNGDKILGLSTELTDLDRKTDGLHSGESIVIAGRTSTGKSSLAHTIVRHNVLQGIPAAIFTAEMPCWQVMKWMLFGEARVNSRRVTPEDQARLAVASGRLSKAPVFIENASGLTIGQVTAVARRLYQQHKIRIVVIDYLQLIGGRGDNREQEVSYVSKGIKALALELNCTVLALSQLTDEGKVRESRAISHDADSLWVIENDGDWQPLIQPVTLHIDKCRDGETGTVPLTFMKGWTRYENRAKEGPEV